MSEWKRIAEKAVECNHNLADQIIELKAKVKYEQERNLNNVANADAQIADLERQLKERSKDMQCDKCKELQQQLQKANEMLAGNMW